jgi:hypothetical protein
MHPIKRKAIGYVKFVVIKNNRSGLIAGHIMAINIGPINIFTHKRKGSWAMKTNFIKNLINKRLDHDFGFLPGLLILTQKEAPPMV